LLCIVARNQLATGPAQPKPKPTRVCLPVVRAQAKSGVLHSLEALVSAALSNPEQASSSLQQMQQILQTAQSHDAQLERGLSVLQQESSAWAVGGPLPTRQ
jgi:regulator of sirC expression with transglutaminase-like and TPR domain